MGKLRRWNWTTNGVIESPLGRWIDAADVDRVLAEKDNELEKRCTYIAEQDKLLDEKDAELARVKDELQAWKALAPERSRVTERQKPSSITCAENG